MMRTVPLQRIAHRHVHTRAAHRKQQSTNKACFPPNAAHATDATQQYAPSVFILAFWSLR